MLRRSKLTAPDFERLARIPCPIASLASCGMRPLSSALAFSWSSPQHYHPGQIAAINSADEASAWAHRNLPAKNTLAAPDAGRGAVPGQAFCHWCLGRSVQTMLTVLTQRPTFVAGKEDKSLRQ